MIRTGDPTRGTRRRGKAPRDNRQVLKAVETLVVSDRETLSVLLGDRFERYAAGFDSSELILALIPRLLARTLDDGAERALYLDARVPVKDPLGSLPDGAIGLDPWPLERYPHPDRIRSIIVPATAAARALLNRWVALVEAVLGEDRPLSARTTLLWLRALAASTHELDIVTVAAAETVEATDGLEAPDDQPYPYREVAGGIPLTATLRRLLRRGPFARPFSELSADQLLRWLAEPEAPQPYVPRYLSALREHRADLNLAFAPGDARGDAGLLTWARTQGVDQDPVLARLCADHVPPPTTSASRPPLSAPALFGVNMVSYWHSELGIADAARLLLSGLDAAHVPVEPISPRTAMPPSRHGVEFVAAGPEAPAFAINLLALNPDGVLAFHDEAGPEFFDGRVTVGYWWWEVLDAFPVAWRPALELIDEVWVGSEHVRAAIAPACSVPVRIVPVPVQPLPAPRPRAELGLPDRFLFATVFDYNSAFERKNPGAVVQAFRRAFPPGSGAALLVKSINAANAPDNRDELAILAEGHPDIHVVDGYLATAQLDAMMGSVDCLVSLHRAEGFGIPLARALSSGIPVVATAYGGNLDFMSEETSYLVDYAPALIPEGNIYPAGARWAEPDIEHAAGLMRQVRERPDQARERALRARERLTRSHSPAAAGSRLALELNRVYGERPLAQKRSAPSARPKVDELRRRISHPFARGREIQTRLLELVELLADAQDRHETAMRLLRERLAVVPGATLAELMRDVRRERELLAGVLEQLRAELGERPSSPSA